MRLFYVSKSSTGLLQFWKNATVVTAVFANIVEKFFLTYNLSLVVLLKIMEGEYYCR